jgi:hypothetical protein
MRFNAKKTLEVYKRKACNISATCSAVDISRTHFYRMRKKNAKFAQGLIDAEESLIDIVESKLISQVNNGNITAIIFFLKSKAKDRGYIEKVEVDSKVAIDPVTVYLPENGRSLKK